MRTAGSRSARYRLTVRFVGAAVVGASLALAFLGNTAYTAARAEQSSWHLVTARLVEAAGPPLSVPGAPVTPPQRPPAEAATQAALWVGLAGLGYATAIGVTARLTVAADRRRWYGAIDREWAQVESEYRSPPMTSWHQPGISDTPGPGREAPPGRT